MRSPRAEIALIAALAALSIGGCGNDGVTTTTQSDAAAIPDPIAPNSVSFDDLHRCEDPKLPPKLRCGKIDLPYERADPSLGTIPISFAVLPRKDRSSPSNGAVIAIEGGPGYGSIGSVKGYAATFGAQLNHRDLLLVDARGTGSSKPIDCPDMQSGRATDDIGMAECTEQLGRRFDSYRSAAAADDINDVRAALGYDEVQMYGDSYGTYLAQSYAFRHGDTLQALVLDSAYPVRGESAWYPSIWRTGIRGLAVACERSSTCTGDAAARLERFVAELRDRRLDVGPLLDAISEAGFSPPASYLRIDNAIASYLAGDEKPYETLTKPGHVGFGKPDGYSVGQELTISCNDYPMLWDKNATWEERRRQFSDAIDSYSKDAFKPFTPAEVALTPDYPYRECLGAPQPGKYYEPAAAESLPAPDVPVLVISGDLDDITSPAEGRAAAAEFPNSTYFLWKNAGHVYSLYDANSKGAVRIRKFLADHQ